MTFHIFPAATCNNNSTNKKPQRSIAIHRLLTFSFAACGNTTGPWRRRKTTWGQRVPFLVISYQGPISSLKVPMLGVLKSSEKQRLIIHSNHVGNTLNFLSPCILKSNQRSKRTFLSYFVILGSFFIKIASVLRYKVAGAPWFGEKHS